MLSNYERDDFIWRTKDGRILKVVDMDYSHLRNALKFVKKRSEIYLQHAHIREYYIQVLALDAHAAILQRELWNREENKATDKLLDRWSGRDKHKYIEGAVK